MFISNSFAVLIFDIVNEKIKGYLKNNMKIIPQTTAAKIAGVSQGYLSQLKSRTHPPGFFTSNGKINIDHKDWKLFAWEPKRKKREKKTSPINPEEKIKEVSSDIKNNSEEVYGPPKGEDELNSAFDIEKAKIRKFNAEAHLQEMKNAKMAGVLVDVSEISSFSTAYINRIQKEIAQCFFKIAPRLMMVFKNDGLEKAVDFYRQEVSKIYEDIKRDKLTELENL